MHFNQRVRTVVLLAFLLPNLVFCAEIPSQKAISNEEFQSLSLDLSENNGFFPTDNLVSNETSYLHVVSHIEQVIRPGGAYIGVGPEQNFSYIAHARPAIVFIVDIRRDNLLHHLWLKELFAASKDRMEYLARLFGRPPPQGIRLSADANSLKLLKLFEGLAPNEPFFKETIEKLWQSIRSKFPRLVNDRDRVTVERIARSFHYQGLEIAYEIPGRPELNFFPSWGSLLIETDLAGRLGHYLNSQESFLFLKRLQQDNRLIPVVGNLSGSKAVQGVAAELKRRELKVSIFYLSNVEFYLFRNGTMSRFIDNLSALPSDERSIVIRSYFNQLTGYRESHPDSVAGHLSVSLVQRIHSLLLNARSRPYTDYWDLVTRDYVPLNETSNP